MADADPPPPERVRHPPSAVLWKFCMERLRELRGPETRERELAHILGFEHSRAVRWKEGNMYVERAEYMLRLADALEVPPMLLVHIAAGDIGIEQARARLVAPAQEPEGKKKRETTAAAEPAPSILLISSKNDQAAYRRALGDKPALLFLVADTLVDGIMPAERHRPELVFLDAGVAWPKVYEVCRLLSSLMAMSGLGCRVVVGVPAGTEEVAYKMAGASVVTSVPFTTEVMAEEIARVGQRLGRRERTVTSGA